MGTWTQNLSKSGHTGTEQMSKILLALCFIFLSSATLADTKFALSSNPPFTISLYQPPADFLEAISELDRFGHIISPGEWSPFRNADIWIFFFETSEKFWILVGEWTKRMPDTWPTRTATVSLKEWSSLPKKGGQRCFCFSS